MDFSVLVVLSNLLVKIDYNYKKTNVMKKILITVAIMIGSFSIMAQDRGHRPLPNQFRDYVEFRQHQQERPMKGQGFQRPNIQRKDGKVIITMSEQQFEKMRMMRQHQGRRVSRQEHGNFKKHNHFNEKKKRFLFRRRLMS